MQLQNDENGKVGKAERNAEWWENFRNLLNDEYDWPANFTFKFIAPKEQVDEIRALFGDLELKIRASSKGTYHSVTAVVLANSAEEIIAVYRAAGKIEGIVSL